jgi:hypothetical protein
LVRLSYFCFLGFGAALSPNKIPEKMKAAMKELITAARRIPRIFWDSININE